MATAEIIIVGLCSILNMNGSDPNMVAPSMICEAPPQDTFGHKAFVAFTTGEFTSTTKGLIQDVPGSAGKYQYVVLKGDEIWLDVDHSKIPTHSDPTLARVARMPEYAKLPSPQYNHAHVPQKGHRPTTAVGSFMRFGAGTLTAAFLTKGDWIFRDEKNHADSSISGKFAREVHYQFTVPANFAIELRPLGSAPVHQLTATTQTPSNIWAGSSRPEDIIKDIQREEGSSGAAGTHFAMFYDQLAAGPHKIFIPYPAGPQPATPDLGYCGPDGKP